MSFMKLPKCPYCGKKLNYIKAWDIRKYGDFMCDQCHNEYLIQYSSGAFLLAVGMIALDVFLFLILGGFDGKLSVFALILMAVPLVMIYFLLPLMMSLRRKKGRAPVRGYRTIAPEPAGRPARTKIYQPKKERRTAGYNQTAPAPRRPAGQRTIYDGENARLRPGEQPVRSPRPAPDRQSAPPRTRRAPDYTPEMGNRGQRPERRPQGSENRGQRPEQRIQRPENREQRPAYSAQSRNVQPKRTRAGDPRQAGTEKGFLSRILTSKAAVSVAAIAGSAWNGIKQGAFLAAGTVKKGASWATRTAVELSRSLLIRMKAYAAKRDDTRGSGREADDRRSKAGRKTSSGGRMETRRGNTAFPQGGRRSFGGTARPVSGRPVRRDEKDVHPTWRQVEFDAGEAGEGDEDMAHTVREPGRDRTERNAGENARPRASGSNRKPRV